LLAAPAAPFAAAAEALYHAPLVVVSHGTEADPLLNYGNAAALALWELAWDAFIGLPSRQTAEPMHREERQRLLDSVHAHGYCDDYAGVRITSTQRRFRILQATVWNVVDDADAVVGQAAAFSDWHWL
jgi:hypothetical protein